MQRGALRRSAERSQVARSATVGASMCAQDFVASFPDGARSRESSHGALHGELPESAPWFVPRASAAGAEARSNSERLGALQERSV